MLVREVQHGLEISCLFCPTTIKLETCSENECGQHFVTQMVFLKHFDDKKDWEKFLAGVLVELMPEFESRHFGLKLVSTADIASDRIFCLDKRVAIPLIPLFGFDGNLRFWICDHCSFKDVLDKDRTYKIQSALSAKHDIWKKYFKETEPQFYKKCAIEKRKATIANKKKVA